MIVKLHIDSSYVCTFCMSRANTQNYVSSKKTRKTKNDNTKTCKNVENTTLISRTTLLYLCG